MEAKNMLLLLYQIILIAHKNMLIRLKLIIKIVQL